MPQVASLRKMVMTMTMAMTLAGSMAQWTWKVPGDYILCLTERKGSLKPSPFTLQLPEQFVITSMCAIKCGGFHKIPYMG